MYVNCVLSVHFHRLSCKTWSDILYHITQLRVKKIFLSVGSGKSATEKCFNKTISSLF